MRCYMASRCLAQLWAFPQIVKRIFLNVYSFIAVSDLVFIARGQPVENGTVLLLFCRTL